MQLFIGHSILGKYSISHKLEQKQQVKVFKTIFLHYIINSDVKMCFGLILIQLNKIIPVELFRSINSV